jgi:hypothetical protein
MRARRMASQSEYVEGPRLGVRRTSQVEKYRSGSGSANEKQQA